MAIHPPIHAIHGDYPDHLADWAERAALMCRQQFLEVYQDDTLSVALVTRNGPAGSSDVSMPGPLHPDGGRYLMTVRASMIGHQIIHFTATVSITTEDTP